MELYPFTDNTFVVHREREKTGQLLFSGLMFLCEEVFFSSRSQKHAPQHTAEI